MDTTSPRPPNHDHAHDKPQPHGTPHAPASKPIAIPSVQPL
ncbi:hypothetical protein [Microbacterium sp. 10M-3C3]|nr:hypothetical protein [Microbacterium sp. 10M-3C3]